MDFDLSTMDSAHAYRYLASVVVPRPIALVTTTDANGHINAAPFSFFNLVGSQPPVVALGVGDREPGTPKDTRGNIARSGEFVVNLVDEALASAMNICAVDFPAGVSELDAAGLTPVPASRVSVPLISESPVQLECRLASIVEIGSNKIVLGEVVSLHIRDEFIDTERHHVRTDALGLIGRMHGGGWYARTTDLFDMPRHSFADWQAAHSE
jgi:flavin reductase (DIM6/NTAB) family NADH-FMN oxidoreductase RutF